MTPTSTPESFGADVVDDADGVTIVSVTERAQLERAWDVRTEVFVHEQHVPIEEEIDDLDTAESTTHVLALEAATGAAVGTGRLLTDPAHPGEVHLGRLAVRAAARGRGIGARLVIALEALAVAGHGVRSDGSTSDGDGPVADGDSPGAVGDGAAAGAGGTTRADTTLAVRVVLSAQETAMEFYRRLGYDVVTGERYLDAGIWHQDMARTVVS
jgi:predicted GNAT family N-acyltransferase